MTGSPAKAAVAGPRSVALIGPYGSGKSTLFEALIAAAGAPLKRPGDIRKRVVTTEVRLGHCSFLSDRWSILDCPGSVEFAYEMEGALAAADLAIVVCEPTAGRASSVPLLLKALEEYRVPHLIFVNKIDTLAGSFDDTLAALQTHSKYPLAARQLPIREGDAVTGYIDVVSGRAFRYGANQGAEPIEIPAATPRSRETGARRTGRGAGRPGRCPLGKTDRGSRADSGGTLSAIAQGPGQRHDRRGLVWIGRARAGHLAALENDAA